MTVTEALYIRRHEREKYESLGYEVMEIRDADGNLSHHAGYSLVAYRVVEE